MKLVLMVIAEVFIALTGAVGVVYSAFIFRYSPENKDIATAIFVGGLAMVAAVVFIPRLMRRP